MSTNLYLLDAGHGGMLVDEYQTRGKCSPEIGVGIGVNEGEFNRDIMGRILYHAGIEDLAAVPLVEGSTNITGEIRRETAQFYIDRDPAVNCIIVSIHANAFGYGPWNHAHGHVVFHRRKSSLQLARVFRRCLHEGVAGDTRDRGIKQRSMSILAPKCLGVLTEAPFMTNRDDAALLASNDFRDRWARAHVRAMEVWDGR